MTSLSERIAPSTVWKVVGRSSSFCFWLKEILLLASICDVEDKLDDCNDACAARKQFRICNLSEKEPCGVNGKRRQGFVEPAQKTCESFMNKSD